MLNACEQTIQILKSISISLLYLHINNCISYIHQFAIQFHQNSHTQIMVAGLSLPNPKQPLWYADKVIYFKMPTPVKIIHHSPVSIFRNIDLSFFSSSFCSACQIDSISKETVPWHPLTYDTCDYLTSMDSYGYLLREKNRFEYSKLM